MKLLVFAASHRAESANRKLAKLAAAHLEKQGAQVDFAEYAEFDMPIYNDETAASGVPDSAQSFARRASKTNGVVLCSPEYNWSYPGSIKNIIDWTSRLKPNPVAGKTVLLMSATPGARGGIVGLNHLRTPFDALQMYVFPRVFPLGHAHNAHETDGGLADAKTHRQFVTLLDEYIGFTTKLTA
jgi:NAD(P)H-dependent FMN reductase